MRVNKTLIIGLVTVLIVVFVYIFGRGQTKTTKNLPYKDISVAEFDTALNNDPFVVDVHIPEQKHIAGTDAFIDYREVGDRLAEFPQDKNAEILLYCRSGSMSTQAAQVLADAGFTNVKNLVGGVQAWREQHQGIELTPDTIDLGTVIYGEIGKAQFTLANNTNKEMKVTRVSTSCSCTSASIEKDMLEAYDTTKVNVEFNPAVHKDDTDLGDITRTIYIETDNINFPKVTVEITAKVIKKT